LCSNRAAAVGAPPYIDRVTKPSFTLFDTAVGRCAIVWNARGIAGIQLPERSERAMRGRLMRRFPGARAAVPPAEVQRAINDIVALLAGEPRNLRYVKIDTAGLSDLQRRVYDVARTIPAGSTLTYGEIAERLGDRMLARDVGQTLGDNPFPIIVPCHRVLAAGGKIGGFSAPGGARTKLRLLAIEGAQPGGPTLFDRLPWAAPPQRPE
jgi:methylated-DNA-[protein]-cysteine S-methyltransferase